MITEIIFRWLYHFKIISSIFFRRHERRIIPVEEKRTISSSRCMGTEGLPYRNLLAGNCIPLREIAQLELVILKR